VFESVPRDAAPERLRNAAILPIAAFVFSEFDSFLYPLFERAPVLLFRSIDLALLAGTVGGALLIARALRGTPIDGRVAAWLLFACCAELLCAWQLLGRVS
jgi:hypothetical protein